MQLTDFSVSDVLIDELNRGALRPLRDAVVDDPSGHLDIQLRGSEVHAERGVTSRVTFHHAQMRLLEVQERDGRFKLSWNKTYEGKGRRKSTTGGVWRHGSGLEALMEDAEPELRRAVSRTRGSRSDEGRVHSHLLRRPPAGVQVVAREYVVEPGLPGGRRRVDVLALDGQGRILAIEVKPMKAVGHGEVDGVLFGQALDYARGVALALRESSEPASMLTRVARQRASLGIPPSVSVPVAKPFVVVPVVALGPGGRTPKPIKALLPRVGSVEVAPPVIWKQKSGVWREIA